MNLVVFGANGQTGRLIVEQAVAEGHSVTAVVRRPSGFPSNARALRVAQADAMDADAVDRVIAGHDAVISALGTPGYTKDPVAIYSVGTANIVKAMQAHGLRRLICISSTGATFEAPPGESLFVRRVYFPLLLRMGRTGYEDIARMESIMQDSDLDWTIARAGGLFDRTADTEYQIVAPGTAARFTARADLADALIRMAVDRGNVGDVVDVVTTKGAPSLWEVARREAFGRAQR
ncbi:NAD(P)-dependent oxidoreductase [Nocardia sp. NPDC051321]|uniref:NAD(P)-dependent oxidoreductase n=1 Tax=Nocardia sp. NPDC051321 TaxID=3364323 RepID=UPI00379A77F6